MKYLNESDFIANATQTHRVSLYTARDIAKFDYTSRYITDLSQDELLYAEKFKSLEDRNRFINCRGILRNIIASKLRRPPNELQFRRNKFGKLMIINSPKRINFSLSHSKDIGAFIFSEKFNVGVDVEYIDRNLEEIIPLLLTTGEFKAFQAINKIDRNQMLFELWTLKEAALKADGHGLMIPLTDIDFQMYIMGNDRNFRAIKALLNGISYKVMQIRLEYGYALALAIEGDSCQVEYFDWKHT